MSGTKKTLVGKAPDGQVVTKVTSGHYGLAGIVKRVRDGGWSIVQHGWSYDSVMKRTRTSYNRGPYSSYAVITLTEVLPEPVRDFFEDNPHHHGGPKIRAAFHPDHGWTEDSKGWLTTRWDGCWAGMSVIRALAREGYTWVSIGDKSHPADFEVAELIPPRRAPRRRQPQAYLPHLGQVTR